MQILVSGDETGLINIWCLKHGQLQILNTIEAGPEGFPITTLCLYNKIQKQGVLIAGYGNGMIRVYTLLSGELMADVSAHAGWITGMDLANKTGRLLTSAEDGYVRASIVKAFIRLIIPS